MIKRLILYLARWQLSTLILAPVIALTPGPIQAAVIGNLIGGVLFFWVDMWIFKQKKG